MSDESAAPRTPRVAVEDVLLCVLGLIAGPLLWWMSHTWQQLSSTSAVQTLEYWIALICGFIGLALCIMWLIFLLSALGLIIGLKSRNAWITYWAEVLTPNFLRRLIVSILGLQVALASQAFASPSEYETSETDGTQHHEPFMPYVHDPAPVPTGAADQAESSASEEPRHESPSDSLGTGEPLTPTHQPSSAAETPPSSPVAEPRQHSEAIVTPNPTSPPTVRDAPPATPRQTSTIEVEHQTRSDMQGPVDQHESPGKFVPHQPLPSPYIAAPNPSRTAEDPTVVVKRGDCLWDIAHHELGAEATLLQIDQRWRQWWDHNRTIIGDDPHALSPGTILQSPPFTS